VLSSATQLVEIIPGSSRTRFRDRPETVRLHRGIGVHLHPGTVFGIIPEYRSDSSRNRVHVRPESPIKEEPQSRPMKIGCVLTPKSVFATYSRFSKLAVAGSHAQFFLAP